MADPLSPHEVPDKTRKNPCCQKALAKTATRFPQLQGTHPKKKTLRRGFCTKSKTSLFRSVAAPPPRVCRPTNPKSLAVRHASSSSLRRSHRLSSATRARKESRSLPLPIRGRQAVAAQAPLAVVPAGSVQLRRLPHLPVPLPVHLPLPLVMPHHRKARKRNESRQAPKATKWT